MITPRTTISSETSGFKLRAIAATVLVLGFVGAAAPARAYEAVQNEEERPNPWVVNGCTVAAKAKCPNADLRFQDLRGANFQGADLHGALFTRSDLRYANFQGANLAGADFRGADLRLVYMQGAKAQNASFVGANLESGRISGSNMNGADFTVADLEMTMAKRATFIGAKQWTEKGGTAAEELNGKRFADAVKASGSPHLVYSSAEGVERKSDLSHYESKWAIEQHIRNLGLAATILRPVGFMDAFGVPAIQRGMFLGIFRANFGDLRPVQFVATHDIGWFAARALEEPELYAGRIIPLAGDELSVGDIIRTFKTVTGRKPWVAPIPAFLAKRAMPKDFLEMFRWIRDKGFEADISQVRREYPQLLTFAGWVKAQTDEH